jgi:two-component system, OmpR family, KDP operon response regulator KdpE
VDQRSNVLIVEDDVGIRQSLFETLTALKFVVGEAENGEEALLRLRMIDYDAVLLDINMPGMGGIETCRRIHHSYTPILRSSCLLCETKRMTKWRRSMPAPTIM